MCASVRISQSSGSSSSPELTLGLGAAPLGCLDAVAVQTKCSQVISSPPPVGSAAMKVKIKCWNGVATWLWVANDENCGICRMAFNGCCPDCECPLYSLPLELCLLAWPWHLPRNTAQSHWVLVSLSSRKVDRKKPGVWAHVCIKSSSKVL